MTSPNVAAIPDRPVALKVKPENIPAQMKARDQWVNWRYEWVVSPKTGEGKWSKVPYTPGTVRRAKSNTRSTWRTFVDALACLHERPDFFDGIGFCPAKDDPFVLGDIDHSQDTDRLPPTYAEWSPGAHGSRWVALASGDYHIKKPNGEIYSYSQFMTITGHVLPGHEVITPCQAAVDHFAAELGGSARTVKDGSAGAGNRAELVKAIPESEWAEGRRLLRTEIDRLVKRVTAAGGEETQLAFVLRGDFAAFHARWSFVGLYRADGTLDASQVRAVAARGIKGRGFTFPEYVAVMSHLYAADALAKWGSKERWREELVALWRKSPDPQRSWAPRSGVIKQAGRVPRGRAGDHHALVEHVYQELQNARAGAQAIVKAGDLAGVIQCHRRTIVTILGELRAAGRIETRPLGQHGGLVVTFSGVIYSAPQEAVSVVLTPETSIADAAPIEETKKPVFLPDRAADHTCPTLAELAAHYLSQPARAIGERLVNERTGLITYRRTAPHFGALVTAEYPYPHADALAAYAAERQRREALAREEWRQFFAWLRVTPGDDLITYIGGRCRTEVAELAREGATFDKHKYQVRLKHAKLELKRRGLTMPSRKTKAAQQAEQAAAQAEQARERAQRPSKERLVACQMTRYDQPPEAAPASVDGGWRAVVARLKARQAAAPAGG